MFQLSKRSIEKLSEVDKALQDVFRDAITYTSVDFGISEGLRSLKRQKEMLKIGASQTLNSKHLKGRAVDVFAYVDGRASWEPPYYFEIAEAVRTSSIANNVAIRWGGAWNVSDIRDKHFRTCKDMHNYYIRSKQRSGSNPFIDLGHFELLN